MEEKSKYTKCESQCAMRIEVEQNTLDWHRWRLGNMTASSIAKIIGKGRAKDAVFTETGLKYLRGVAYGRMVSDEVWLDDERSWMFVRRNGVETAATRWGHDNELMARFAYQKARDVKVTDGAMYRHGVLKHLTASPDGLVGDDGLVEIKCPYGNDAFMLYASTIFDAASLNAGQAYYYWQVQCQLEVTGRDWCDFVVYDPDIVGGLHIARIERVQDDIDTMLERVAIAEQYVCDLINAITNF